MELYFRPLAWADALAVARWRYPAPYQLYDLARGQMLGSVAIHRVTAPLRRIGFYAVASHDDPLIGVFSFRKLGYALEIGLGLRPDLTGQHHGLAFVRAGLAFGRATYAPISFRLDVATFNQRAIRVYERAGFVAGRSFTRYTRLGAYEFIEMTRPAHDPTAAP
ncbi:MAG TPA: GNAT family N-acetyltransferase [Kouleothrix sp.]|mgnify:CR=1 FL=1|uniref:GNAT family N-acetyltransferase n=1 Tax=Kouleothrix sp. TaxID=2779161 RepID=UPI002BF9DE45|nr:GNAT family N-acetyltransferase [Kouleothrix sp.]HRC74797.1 GNAT family N-acetyltransferase [Kouleothrix sp.]